MAAHLDRHERIVQICLGVALEGSLQFSVNRLQRGRCKTEVDHAAVEALKEDQRSEVAVSRDENPLLLARRGEELSVGCLNLSRVGGGNDIVSEVAEKANSRSIDVLVGQESHVPAARCRSSTPRTSMA